MVLKTGPMAKLELPLVLFFFFLVLTSFFISFGHFYWTGLVQRGTWFLVGPASLVFKTMNKSTRKDKKKKKIKEVE